MNPLQNIFISLNVSWWLGCGEDLQCLSMQQLTVSSDQCQRYQQDWAQQQAELQHHCIECNVALSTYHILHMPVRLLEVKQKGFSSRLMNQVEVGFVQ